MKKWVTRVVAILILLALVNFTLPSVTGGPKMKSFCNLHTEELKLELINRARNVGYRTREFIRDGVEPVLVIDDDAMGRFTCNVSFSDGYSKTYRYINLD
jgi:hypothetical protein